MWDTLLNNLPLVITILLAVFLCGMEIYKHIKTLKQDRDARINEAVAERQHDIDMQNEFNKLHTKLDEMAEKHNQTMERLDKMESQVQDLIESDKNDIRAWIVEQYHIFYVNKGWIDAFSADTIEKRYGDYKKEGGNSYIEELVRRLRSLPMDPQSSAHSDDDSNN